MKDDSHFIDEVKGKPLGHAPYLSPEVLEGWVSGQNLSCDQLKKADVYALGLVMWEVARRCLIQGEHMHSMWHRLVQYRVYGFGKGSLGVW